jgi:hypothetical protein
MKGLFEPRGPETVPTVHATIAGAPTKTFMPSRQAAATFPCPMKASNSAFTLSFSVEHIP